MSLRLQMTLKEPFTSFIISAALARMLSRSFSISTAGDTEYTPNTFLTLSIAVSMSAKSLTYMRPSLSHTRPSPRVFLMSSTRVLRK